MVTRNPIEIPREEQNPISNQVFLQKISMDRNPRVILSSHLSSFSILGDDIPRQSSEADIRPVNIDSIIKKQEKMSKKLSKMISSPFLRKSDVNTNANVVQKSSKDVSFATVTKQKSSTFAYADNILKKSFHRSSTRSDLIMTEHDDLFQSPLFTTETLDLTLNLKLADLKLTESKLDFSAFSSSKDKTHLHSLLRKWSFLSLKENALFRFRNPFRKRGSVCSNSNDDLPIFKADSPISNDDLFLPNDNISRNESIPVIAVGDEPSETQIPKEILFSEADSRNIVDSQSSEDTLEVICEAETMIDWPLPKKSDSEVGFVLLPDEMDLISSEVSIKRRISMRSMSKPSSDLIGREASDNETTIQDNILNSADDKRVQEMLRLHELLLSPSPKEEVLKDASIDDHVRPEQEGSLEPQEKHRSFLHTGYDIDVKAFHDPLALQRKTMSRSKSFKERSVVLRAADFEGETEREKMESEKEMQVLHSDAEKSQLEAAESKPERSIAEENALIDVDELILPILRLPSEKHSQIGDNYKEMVPIEPLSSASEKEQTSASETLLNENAIVNNPEITYDQRDGQDALSPENSIHDPLSKNIPSPDFQSEHLSVSNSKDVSLKTTKAPVNKQGAVHKSLQWLVFKISSKKTSKMTTQFVSENTCKTSSNRNSVSCEALSRENSPAETSLGPWELEKQIYRLSHAKLTNTRRDLCQQVLISNLMMHILNVHADLNLSQDVIPKKLKPRRRRQHVMARNYANSVYSASSLIPSSLTSNTTSPLTYSNMASYTSSPSITNPSLLSTPPKIYSNALHSPSARSGKIRSNINEDVPGSIRKPGRKIIDAAISSNDMSKDEAFDDSKKEDLSRLTKPHPLIQFDANFTSPLLSQSDPVQISTTFDHKGLEKKAVRSLRKNDMESDGDPQFASLGFAKDKNKLNGDPLLITDNSTLAYTNPNYTFQTSIIPPNGSPRSNFPAILNSSSKKKNRPLSLPPPNPKTTSSISLDFYKPHLELKDITYSKNNSYASSKKDRRGSISSLDPSLLTQHRLDWDEDDVPLSVLKDRRASLSSVAGLLSHS